MYENLGEGHGPLYPAADAHVYNCVWLLKSHFPSFYQANGKGGNRSSAP